jgi:hypothetical protein
MRFILSISLNFKRRSLSESASDWATAFGVIAIFGLPDAGPLPKMPLMMFMFSMLLYL